ncbi:MAG TPA: OmpH family outer membrane protein [Bacteroidales bacterium]|jgi:outer membrane protein|nr:OmpH family outer membrane protein [Bacteroidales bacterium]HPT09513.1 OmpH family outer membrane protein [Bacteroidales bacterium]
MKKLIITMVTLLFMVTWAQAQKFAYVDTEYILDNIPEFTEAQAQLDEISSTWQKEIETQFAEVDKMYKDYQVQSVLLPDDMKKKKEQEIIDKEKEVKNLQRTRFGKDGDLFKKRQELVKPIQERIYNAIQEIATNNNYAVIFDKGGSLTMMYANPKYDISDEVLDNLGASLSGRKTKTKTSTGTGAGTSQPTKSGGTQTKTGGSKSSGTSGDNSGSTGTPPTKPLKK